MKGWGMDRFVPRDDAGEVLICQIPFFGYSRNLLFLTGPGLCPCGYQTRACALHKVTASANLTTTANIDCPGEKPSTLGPCL